MPVLEVCVEFKDSLKIERLMVEVSCHDQPFGEITWRKGRAWFQSYPEMARLTAEELREVALLVEYVANRWGE
jgi:hypothetical protein